MADSISCVSSKVVVSAGVRISVISQSSSGTEYDGNVDSELGVSLPYGLCFSDTEYGSSHSYG